MDIPPFAYINVVDGYWEGDPNKLTVLGEHCPIQPFVRVIRRQLVLVPIPFPRILPDDFFILDDLNRLAPDIDVIDLRVQAAYLYASALSLWVSSLTFDKVRPNGWHRSRLGRGTYLNW